MVKKRPGWYHFSAYGDTRSIENYPDTPTYDLYDLGDHNAYGPFKTFAEAKRDAYQYHQTTKRDAMMGMMSVRKFKARKKAC